MTHPTKWRYPASLQFATTEMEAAPRLSGTGSVMFGNSIAMPEVQSRRHRIFAAGGQRDLIVGEGVSLGGQSGRLSQIVHAGQLTSEAGAIIELRHFTTSPGRIDLTQQAGRLFLRSVDPELAKAASAAVTNCASAARSLTNTDN